MTNGASLVSDESRWYWGDGGASWMINASALVSDVEGDNDDDHEENDENIQIKEETEWAPAPVRFTLNSKMLEAGKMVSEEKETDESKLYGEQLCTDRLRMFQQATAAVSKAASS